MRQIRNMALWAVCALAAFLLASSRAQKKGSSAMISQWDLYDISAALIIVRNDIQNNLNCDILAKISDVLKCSEQKDEENPIRRALASLHGLDSSLWNYVYHDNVYVMHRMVKDSHIYDLLLALCMESLRILEMKNFERARDLLDSYHCLPNMIADNHFSVPNAYWRTYIQPYRRKWDQTFLRAEQNFWRKRSVHLRRMFEQMFAGTP
ncbi:MAG: hypothetical protein KHX36_06555 [Clostridiales bacterium]|nr:hypothetical protein [Clostridiales bacterium]